MLAKYQQVKRSLMADIMAGKYSVGAQLPSCRDLAARWGVSFITASKAVNELAIDNYIEIIQGKGAFVRYRESGSFLTEKKAKVFFPLSSHSNVALFYESAGRMLKSKGWDYELVSISSDAELLRQVRDCGHYSLVCGFWLSDVKTIAELCNAGQERLIIVGERYDRLGISSSTWDNSMSIRLAMAEMRVNRRQRVALFCSNLTHAHEALDAAVWRNLFESDNPDLKAKDYLWNAEIMPFTDVETPIRTLLETKLHEGMFDQLDGIITTDDEKAVILNAFCQDHGIPIPDKISLITVNNSRMTTLVSPKLTCIDTDLERQVANAVNMMEDKCAGEFDGVNLRLAEPRLITRDSVSRKIG